jgi:putative SOS response-associated peptidase YedK
MPVILKREAWGHWLDGAPDKAGLLCQPYPDLIVVERTADPWVRRASQMGGLLFGGTAKDTRRP